MRRWFLAVAASAVFAAAVVIAPPAAAYKFLEGVYWPPADGPVGYMIDPAGSDDINDGSDVQAVKDAFQAWECVLCSTLEFRDDGEPPYLRAEYDALSVIYWVERDEDYPFGPGTLSANVLGQAISNPSPDPEMPPDADVIFNGVHHLWSTADPVPSEEHWDVGTIALHELGHLLGLGHPCEDENDTNTCVPADRSVMFPYVTPYTIEHDPLEDDRAGVCELYAGGKDDCNVGGKLGELCELNCDCKPGLDCVLGIDDTRYCSERCTGDDTKCPRGFFCSLAARPTEDGPAPGACLKFNDPDELPASAACTRDLQCASDNCSIIPALGRTGCVQSCTDAASCPDDRYICDSSRCVFKGPDRGIPCPEEEPEEGCGCSSARAGASLGLGALLLMGLLWRRRTRGLTALTLLAALALSPLASATVVEAMDLERMIELSDVIVHARVMRVAPQAERKHGYVFTEVELQVREVVKGEAGGRLTLLLPGGTLDGVRYSIPATSSFEPGEEMVLFLSRWREHLVQVAVGVGKLRVDRSDPETPRVFDLSRGVAMRPAAGGGQLGMVERMPDLPLEDFMTELRARVEFER